MKTRCSWANSSKLYIKYHDNDWGVPLHDDNKLFEYLILEGAQAGLSWLTILNKRENYRRAYQGFNPKQVAKFSAMQIEELINNEGIVRNRLKINASINNAIKFLEVQREFGSFDAYQWQFVKGQTIQNKWQALTQIPAETTEAINYSKDLAARGFKFVGPKIIYAHMQATGMVNDHIISCFRYNEVKQESISK